MLRRFFLENKLLFSVALLARGYILRFFNFKKAKLDKEELKILKTLKKDGIVVIPNYFSKEQCKTMKKEFDKFVENHSVYCKENERRVFGIEKLSQYVNEVFSKDRLSWRVCESYLGEKMVLQSTMMARIDYKENIEYGSGGSWHRDSFSRQVKSITYLEDMNDENGPFMFIKGTHKISSILKVLFFLKRKRASANYSRLSNKDIESAKSLLRKDISYFPCRAGTLILADIRGLHTTRYLKSGHAYSLFNYYVASQDDISGGHIRTLSKECIKGKSESSNDY